MQLRVLEAIDAVDASAWDRLAAGAAPFLAHGFLAALEDSGAAGPRFGWLPRHLVLEDGGRLLGAMPLYLKNNSYGEFVFDWAWAEAFEKGGGRYYPKAVCSVPYTPATGPRLLVAPGADAALVRRNLVRGAIDLAGDLGLSSVHWLFPDAGDTDALEAEDLLLRLGVQFHWTNPGYGSFEDFLGALSAKKRKNIRQTRRRVLDAGFRFRIVHGDQASEQDLRLATDFYTETFDRKWGTATLNLAFFREVARNLGRGLVLIFAEHSGRTVAGAILFRNDRALYGRHWGSHVEADGLHFETCYHQGIEYAIREGLRLFEPGAQGEHKISRGFLPTPTWSAHWIADRAFRTAVADFLGRERRAVTDYWRTLNEHLPYRADALPPRPAHVRALED